MEPKLYDLKGNEALCVCDKLSSVQIVEKGNLLACCRECLNKLDYDDVVYIRTFVVDMKWDISRIRKLM